jgi:hypothetical protein
MFDRYMRESYLIKLHNSALNTNDPGAGVVNYDDERDQYCGKCGVKLYIQDTCISKLNKHFETKKCQNATPPIIIRGKNNTINMTIANGRKRPIIIEGDDNTLNIHYPSTD